MQILIGISKMKTCLIILSLLFAFIFDCKGQKFKTQKAKSNLIIRNEPYRGEPIPIDTFNKYWKPYLDSIGYRYDPIPKYDTLPAIMLVCDTELKEYETFQMGIPYTYKDFDNSVRWQQGYLVKYARGIPENSYSGSKPYAEYLDENKKRLPKNIIVWMAKQVNQ